MITDTGDRLVSRAAEGAVLSSMLIDPACIDGVLALVSIEDFALPENRIIFQTIQKLHSANGKFLDGLIVRDALDQAGQLDKVGGVDYLREVIESVVSSASAEYYCKMLKEKSQRRRLVDVGQKIKEAIDSPDPVSECVFQVQQIAAGLDGALEPSGGSQPIVKTLSDVEALPINWLWFNRIPAGMLTLIAGDGGLGKSFLSLYMAAKISTGGAWPDGDSLPDNSAPLGSVVLLTAEDDLARTVRPRLDSLEADVTRIVALEGVKVRDENGGQRSKHFSLQHDLPALRQAVTRLGDCRLVILDPLSAYLGGGVDSHRDSDVRSVLAPLVQLAEDTGVAVVGIMHLNKSVGGKAVYRALGSIAFTAAARTAWLVTADPQNPESKRRLLTPLKHNILISPMGLGFEIIDGKVVFEAEAVTMTSDEALGQGSTVVAAEKERAVVWLREIMPPGTSLAWTEIVEQGGKQGITEGTLQRAKTEAGVKSYQVRVGDKRQWLVHIPK